MAKKKQQRIITACVDCSDCKKVKVDGSTKWRCAEKRKFLSGEVNFIIEFPDWCPLLVSLPELRSEVVSILEEIEHVEVIEGEHLCPFCGLKKPTHEEHCKIKILLEKERKKK